MSQENAEDQEYNINNSFGVESYHLADMSLDLSKYSKSKCFTPADLHLMIKKEVSKITEVFPFVSFRLLSLSYQSTIIKFTFL